ncbi:MAG: hypothetical protein FJW34_21880 [Acidobacteria bacterium]|nr:hypothetical protein [Acidobacteriota bacterium]
MDKLNEQVLATFGREVTYTPQGGAPFTVTGILEEGRRTEETTPGVYTAIFFRASALPAPPQRGDQVRIASTTYKVVDVDADAEGGVRLVLHKL